MEWRRICWFDIQDVDENRSNLKGGFELQVQWYYYWQLSHKNHQYWPDRSFSHDTIRFAETF